MTRQTLLSLLALSTLVSTPVAAQTPLETELGSLLRTMDQATIYFTVDKPLYRPGETIWFRAWEVGSLSGLSQQAHAVTITLVDPRGGTLFEKNVWSENGVATNDFELSESLVGGEYLLRMQSSLGPIGERAVIVSTYESPRVKKTLEFVRKSYAAGDEVTASVELVRATGEVMANAAFEAVAVLDGVEIVRTQLYTDAKGQAVVRFSLPQSIARGDGTLTVLINDAGVTESIQKRIPITPSQLDVRFYPEGGELVLGLPSRVYFQAKTPLGKAAEVKGKLVDDRGTELGTIESFYGGMGRFELTPEPERRYFVELSSPVQTLELPAALASGCTLRARDLDPKSARTVELDVACNTDTDVALAGSLRGEVVAATEKEVGAKGKTLALALPKGSFGALRVTLFGPDRQPLGERLVYVGLRAGIQVELTTDREVYAPRDEVTLTLTIRDPQGNPIEGSFALAVVDDTILNFADDKTANILAGLLLLPEMPGQTIEEPNFYFSDDERAPKAMDLLLGTQGWRRFR